MSDFHVEVIDMLERMGVGLMYETPFPPYVADIYVPDAHAVIEADGPDHSDSHDRKRDHVLSSTYQLWIYRVRHNDWRSAGGRDRIRRRLWSFIQEAREDAEERFELVKDKIAWL